MKLSFHHPDSILGKENREAEERRAKNKENKEKAHKIDNSASPYSDRDKFPRLSYNPSVFKYPEHEEAHRTWIKEHEHPYWNGKK